MRFCLVVVAILGFAAHGAELTEDRAAVFLSKEVPRWARENKCYSCHNNGDAARALYVAYRFGYQVAPEALADTTAWLRRPLEWDNNRGDPNASDKRLARIQFAAALVEALDSGLLHEREPLLQAAEGLVKDQAANGAWPVEQEADVGSPATYGSPLATFMAIRTLRKAGPERFKPAIDKAEQWLLGIRVRTIPDAAAILWTFAGREDPKTIAVRGEALDLVLRSQNGNGGWGPYPHTPSEPFDTAVTILALESLRPGPPVWGKIDRARIFLMLRQLPTGGWPETTRPPGSQSYAQHMSTTGWATQAMVVTRREGGPQRRR
jgi:hypothetical protein